MADTPNQPAAPPVQRGIRKERLGEVVSDKMTRTIVVRIERRHQHPRFKKVVTSHKRLYAHDEKQEARVGDHVRVAETRPISKLKRWRLVEIVKRAVQTAPAD